MKMQLSSTIAIYRLYILKNLVILEIMCKNRFIKIAQCKFP